MNDSVDIKKAVESLTSALQKLESAVQPLGSKISQLESSADDTESFLKDRTKLASELDNAKADQEVLEAQMKKREEEFERLAGDTTQELDRVIRHVQSTLEGLAQ